MKFNVDDIVTYELSWWGKPRWINNTDRGGSGIWEKGKIIECNNDNITVCAIKNSTISYWPMINHPAYTENQWYWDGYITVINNNKSQNNRCDCGAIICKTTHSNWCSSLK